MRTLYAKHMSRKPLQKWALQQPEEKTKKWKNTAICQNYHFVPVGIEIYGTYGPQGIKLVSRSAKKIRMLQVKNCLLFFYSKVYQWQCTKALQFALWVTQRIHLQAYRAYLIFKYMKLKSYDKKIIYT